MIISVRRTAPDARPGLNLVVRQIRFVSFPDFDSSAHSEMDEENHVGRHIYLNKAHIWLNANSLPLPSLDTVRKESPTVYDIDG